MTIIVASTIERCMCSDSMAIDSDEETLIPCVKVFRARGHLLGFAGNMAEIRPLVEWYRKHPDRRGDPPPARDTEMLILAPDGLVGWTKVDGFHAIDSPTHAIGAGKQIAMTALDCNASVKRAAQLAVKYSAKCAGPIITRKLRA